MPLLSGSVVHVIKATPWPCGRWASCSTTWCRATSPSRRTSRSATPRWTSAATCRRSARSWSEAAFASDPRTGWTCLTCSTTPGSPPQLEEVMGRRGEAAMRTYHHTMDTSPLQLPLENRCSLPPAAICHPPVTNKQTNNNNYQSTILARILTSHCGGTFSVQVADDEQEGNLKTNYANLNPVDNVSVWKMENLKLLSFCNVPYRSKFPTKWIEDLCAPLAYMGGTKNLAYTCFRLPAKTYLLVNLRKRLHVHLKKQNQRIYIFNKRKKKF